MSAFGKQQEAGDSVDYKLFTGVENFKVVALNPTKEELETMYGREIKFTPEYLGETEVEDGADKRTVPQIRLDFYLANEDNSITTKLQYYIANTFHKSQTGKFRSVNIYGKDAWLTEDVLKSGVLPDNMSWYNSEGVKVAKRGEVELLSFMINLLNLPYDPTKADDASDCHAQISKEDWAKIFTGDVSFLRNIIASCNNKIGVLLGVKTKTDGKLVQSTFNKSTLRQYVKSQTKATKYKYILKDLHEAKANGAFGNVDFGSDLLELSEHNVKATAITTENTNQGDIFASEPAGGETGDSEDWLG